MLWLLCRLFPLARAETPALIVDGGGGRDAGLGPEKPPVVVVVSGGGSKGAYLAGQLFVITEHLKAANALRQAPDDLSDTARIALGREQDVVITGASAGAVNALLASLALTDPAQMTAPEHSPFFSAWIQMGIDQTRWSMDFVPENPDQTSAVFSVATADALVSDMEAIFMENLQSRVSWAGSLRLGLTTTRIQPRVGEGTVYRDVKEAFALSLPSRAGGQAEWLSLRCDPELIARTKLSLQESREPLSEAIIATAAESGGEPPVAMERVAEPQTAQPIRLPDTGLCGAEFRRLRPVAEPAFNFSLLADLVRASSAGPIVFAPQVLRCEDYDRITFWGGKCQPFEQEFGTVMMLDGGVFDNNPARLGHELTRSMSSGPDPQAAQPDLLTRIIFPDPDLSARLWEDQPNISASSLSEGIGAGEVFGVFLKPLVSLARTQALADYIRDFGPQLDTLLQRTNPASAHAAGFLGFYDRTIRAWDFYAGMYDAMIFLDGQWGPSHYGDAGWQVLRDQLLPEKQLSDASFYWRIRSSFESLHPNLDVGSPSARVRTELHPGPQRTLSREEVEEQIQHLVFRQFEPAINKESLRDGENLLTIRRAARRHGVLKEVSHCGIYPYIPLNEPDPLAYCAGEPDTFDERYLRASPPRGMERSFPRAQIHRNLEVLTLLAMLQAVDYLDAPTAACRDWVQAECADRGLKTDAELRSCEQQEVKVARQCRDTHADYTDAWFLGALNEGHRLRNDTGEEGLPSEYYFWFLPFDLSDEGVVRDSWTETIRRRIYFEASNYIASDDVLGLKGSREAMTRWALGSMVGYTWRLALEAGPRHFGLAWSNYSSYPAAPRLQTTAQGQMLIARSRADWLPRRFVSARTTFWLPDDSNDFEVRTALGVGGALDLSVLHRPDPFVGHYLPWALELGLVSLEPGVAVSGRLPTADAHLQLGLGSTVMLRSLGLIGVGAQARWWSLTQQEDGWSGEWVSSNWNSSRSIPANLSSRLSLSLQVTLPPGHRAAPPTLDAAGRREWRQAIREEERAE